MERFQRISVYLRVLVYSLVSALTAYLHSSFLRHLSFNSSTIDLVYISVSVIGVCCVWTLALGRRSIHEYQILLFCALACIVGALSGIIFASNIAIILISFIVLLSLDSPLFFIFDELLENVSENISTGKIRSWYLLAQNSVWIIAPILSMVVFGDLAIGGFKNIYQIGLFLGMLVLAIQMFILVQKNHNKIPSTKPTNPFNIRAIPAIISHGFLHLSYALTVTITPIYLHMVLGWDWPVVGIITAVSLLAFPIIQIPLGKFLDIHHTEYGHITVGLLCMSVSLFYFAQSAVLTPLLATIILFLNRAGAATVEMSNESVFFKTVTTNDRSTIAMFRTMSPLLYILAPVFFFISTHYGFSTLYIGLSIVLTLGSAVVHIANKRVQKLR